VKPLSPEALAALRRVLLDVDASPETLAELAAAGVLRMVTEKDDPRARDRIRWRLTLRGAVLLERIFSEDAGRVCRCAHMRGSHVDDSPHPCRYEDCDCRSFTPAEPLAWRPAIGEAELHAMALAPPANRPLPTPITVSAEGLPMNVACPTCNANLGESCRELAVLCRDGSYSYLPFGNYHPARTARFDAAATAAGRKAGTS